MTGDRWDRIRLHGGNNTDASGIDSSLPGLPQPPSRGATSVRGWRPRRASPRAFGAARVTSQERPFYFAIKSRAGVDLVCSGERALWQPLSRFSIWTKKHRLRRCEPQTVEPGAERSHRSRAALEMGLKLREFLSLGFSRPYRGILLTVVLNLVIFSRGPFPKTERTYSRPSKDDEDDRREPCPLACAP
jgi:hypothetical protein